MIVMRLRHWPAKVVIAMTVLVLFCDFSLAADPPACADVKVLQQIRFQYEMAEQAARPARKLAEIKDVREASLGPPPASANQYATAKTFIAISRYCEGRVEFDAGDPEPIYWRIDQAKDGPGEYTHIDHCSKRHDAFQDGCKWFRPGS
jgi:hypothetical protein